MREFKERKKPSQSSDAFFKPTVQTKLSVGQAGDQYEQEADATADRVVNASNSESVSKGTSGDGKPLASGISSVQMKEMAPAEDEKAVQKKEEEKEPIQKKDEEQEPIQKKEEEKKEPEVQKKEENQEEVVQPKEEEEKPVQKKQNTLNEQPLEEKLKMRNGKGEPLKKDIKREMEKRFGADFSAVRIHTDNEAQTMAAEMGAQAFTRGNDIYFNSGKYNPESTQGKLLLAHELTHVLQQGNHE